MVFDWCDLVYLVERVLQSLIFFDSWKAWDVCFMHLIGHLYCLGIGGSTYLIGKPKEAHRFSWLSRAYTHWFDAHLIPQVLAAWQQYRFGVKDEGVQSLSPDVDTFWRPYCGYAPPF